MVEPWMMGLLVFFPSIVSIAGIIILALLGWQEYAQGHIGRLGIAANAFFLWQIFFTKWLLLPELFQWYLNLGTLFGIVGVGSYILRESLPTIFYRVALILYGSVSILLIIVLGLSGVPLM